jgi:hypothetical protein
MEKAGLSTVDSLALAFCVHLMYRPPVADHGHENQEKPWSSRSRFGGASGKEKRNETA